MSSAGREAVELAASAGLVLDAWQAMVLEGALGERADGRWAALDVGLVLPRQNGKGSILEARELAGLFLFGERLIVHSAHQFDTSLEAFRRLLALIEDNPAFEHRVMRVSHSHGEEGLELRGGQRIRFRTRTRGGGRGFSGDTVILDEAMELNSESVSALYPTLSARPNPQVWFVGSAPTQLPPSEVLRGFCRRGRRGSAGLAYFEWCAEPDDDQADPVTVAKANPAFGIRITDEFIEHERGVLGEDFPRERLGIWADTERSGEPVISEADWRGCVDTKSGPVGTVAFALDVAPSRSHGAFAVAGASGRGGVHVEVVDYRPGTGWLVGRAKELHDRWGGQLAIATGSPAASLIGELEATNVPVLEVPAGDHAQACGRFFDAVAQRELRHLEQFELDQAIDAAERKFYGDAWLWARRPSVGDISPLVAVTLAMWAFEQSGPAMAVPEAIVI